jgi:hypothetical protein
MAGVRARRNIRLAEARRRATCCAVALSVALLVAGTALSRAPPDIFAASGLAFEYKRVLLSQPRMRSIRLHPADMARRPYSCRSPG